MRTLFGVWLSGSILLNAFWVWIGRIWNGSNPAWALGFPIAVLAVVSCVMVGAVKQRGALITIGLIAYGVLWTLLVIDKWRISITTLSALNFLLLIAACWALHMFKGVRQ